jgi:hypothetical protein
MVSPRTLLPEAWLVRPVETPGAALAQEVLRDWAELSLPTRTLALASILLVLGVLVGEAWLRVTEWRHARRQHHTNRRTP